MGSQIVISIIIIIIIGMIINYHIDNYKIKKAIKKLRMGDTFIKEIVGRNPFEEMFSYTVEVIEVKEGWIKYWCIYSNSKKIKIDEIERFYNRYMKK